MYKKFTFSSLILSEKLFVKVHFYFTMKIYIYTSLVLKNILLQPMKMLKINEMIALLKFMHENMNENNNTVIDDQIAQCLVRLRYSSKGRAVVRHIKQEMSHWNLCVRFFSKNTFK